MNDQSAEALTHAIKALTIAVESIRGPHGNPRSPIAIDAPELNAEIREIRTTLTAIEGQLSELLLDR